MVIFRRTLRNFVTVLKERKVDVQLGIVIKDPSEFTVEYILEIISRLGESSGSPSKIRSCKKFIKSCYRKVEDNRGVVEGILTMVPNDIYGSLISGGFTLILAVSLSVISSLLGNYCMRPDTKHCIRPSRSKSSSAKRFRTGWPKFLRS